MSPKKIRLEISSDDPEVSYLRFPSHPGMIPGIVKKTIRLHDLIGSYSGADLYFHFAENDVLIGVEILE